MGNITIHYRDKPSYYTLCGIWVGRTSLLSNSYEGVTCSNCKRSIRKLRRDMTTKREMMSTNERLVMLEKYIIYLHGRTEDILEDNDLYILTPISSLDEFIEREIMNGNDNNT